MDTRRAWWVWGTGVFAYLVAITQRTSFGVAGLAATERFDASAAALSAFTVIQLIVYAGLQVPVGLLVDRFGSRVMIAGGAVLMCLGQLQLAFAATVPGGLAGRLLVGAGDAMTFVSVMRLLPVWFGPKRIPVLTQLTGMLGMLGQIISAVPFAALLHLRGWTGAFLAAGALSVLAAVLAAALIRDVPAGAVRPVPQTLRQTGLSLSGAWKQAGTRLGLWSHFTVQFAGNVFVLAWGYPFLASAQGLGPGTASVLMTLFVLVALVCGPFVGTFVSRHPMRRSSLVLLITAATAAVWLAVILYPGRAPLWLLVLLVVVLAGGGPGSMIAFDFARTFNPVSRVGTATGIVNVGGFVAALLVMFGIGLILDALLAGGFSGGQLYALESFKLALSLQFVFLAGGAVALLATRRRVRAQLAEQGVIIQPLWKVLVSRTRTVRPDARTGRNSRPGAPQDAGEPGARG
ncbi:MFS transporter [Arthrobacter mobilis]|uniref:Lysosomal dipeptide transporter MFSD1 n=1 Tax=Arthrobacter mobilis TaxID=2724944 RepID=A0A7X6HF82_9MICC|nr:MFS transporter [Arthrobacter mobilis]NKX54906.1 MFS transporter [Arthrobacter mobilis]